MKHFLWNVAKLFWVIITVLGYVLYFVGEIEEVFAMIWIAVLSLSLASIYSFLSTYRLGPEMTLEEFNPATDVAEFNAHQWLVRFWTVLSIGIIIPAFYFRRPWVLIVFALLACGLIVACALVGFVAIRCRGVAKKFFDELPK